METPAERIMLLRVPIDIVPPEELPEIINRLMPPLAGSEYVSPNLLSRSSYRPAAPGCSGASDQGSLPATKGRDIILLSLWDLLRARRNNEYRNYVLNAALVIPISKSLVSGAKFLTGKKVVRYMPFNFVISLLTCLERQEYPLYLLGGKNRIMKKTERNIHSTFPRLKIVGRCGGPIRKQDEPAIIEAIRKVSPSLLLAGKGIRGEELWIARNGSRLNSGFRLWCSDLFDIFAEKKRRPSDLVFDRGLESLGFCMRNPLKFFRIFPYFRYKLLLLVYKIFKR